jgi:hypothetical protein
MQWGVSENVLVGGNLGARCEKTTNDFWRRIAPTCDMKRRRSVVVDHDRLLRETLGELHYQLRILMLAGIVKTSPSHLGVSYYLTGRCIGWVVEYFVFVSVRKEERERRRIKISCQWKKC